MFSPLSRRAALLCATLIPAPLLADVSPEDVWQNMQDMVSPMDLSLTADMNRSGDTLALRDVTYGVELPFEVGTFTVNLGQLDLKDLGDGTVAMLSPENTSYVLKYTNPQGASRSASMDVIYTDANIIVAGAPGDVSYDYEVGRMDISLSNFEIPNVIHSMAMQGFAKDHKASIRAKIGETVEISSTHETGEQEFTFTQRAPEDGVVVDTQGKQGAKSMSGDAHASMPREGMSILNLAAALRSGLSLNINGDATGYFSEQTSSVDGQQVMTQSAVTEHYEMRMGLDWNGFAMSGPIRNARLDIEMMQPMPLQLGMDIASGSASFLLPLLKTDTFAPYEVSFDLAGLSLDESIWSLFDPGAVLPRTPVDMALAASGHARNMVDWLDFLTVETAMADLTGLAFEPQDLTLESVRISAAGAEVTGKGAMTFDNSGSEPLPIGTTSFEISGANALIDRLIEAGLITDEDATGARMGLAMMTIPAVGGGEDQLSSEVEMTAEGHVYVNGNRMK